MQQAGHCKHLNLAESGQMSRGQEQISARSRDNHLMTRRRYISVEELIWRELGEFLPKDAFHDVNTRSSNTEKSLRLTTSCILGRLASRKNKGDFSASRTLSRASPSLPSRQSFPLIALLPLLVVTTGTVLSRNNNSHGPPETIGSR